MRGLLLYCVIARGNYYFRTRTVLALWSAVVGCAVRGAVIHEACISKAVTIISHRHFFPAGGFVCPRGHWAACVPARRTGGEEERKVECDCECECECECG